MIKSTKPRTPSLNRADVATRIAAALSCPVAVAKRHLDVALDVIAEAVAAGNRVELRGFAVFERKKTKGGQRQNVAARNPRIVEGRKAKKLPPLPTVITVGPKFVAVARCTMRMPVLGGKKAA